MVGFQSSGPHGGDQPGGAPYNIDCTLSSVTSHTNATAEVAEW